MRRRINVASAGADLAFALLALVAGLFGAPPMYAAMVIAGSVAAWGWTRRAPLAAMEPARRLTQGAIAVAMIAVVLGLAYWIGLIFGGHT